ncbi:MAG: hypothetical protein ACREIV_04930, partial [Planctomycetaceae bacterium]
MPESETELDVYKEWLGIPEGPRPPDHYTLLRLVQFEDDEEKVRAHYRKLNAHVRKYATGKHSVRSQELLNELAKAMLCLTDPQCKREYDQGLGRKVEEDRQTGRTLGQILVDDGLISDAQREEAENYAEARGLSMRDAVVQMKLADQETATRALAKELGHSYLDLSEVSPADSTLDRLPRNVVKRYSILPLFEDDDAVLVACVHEPTPDLEDEMRLRYGMPLRAVLATPKAVDQAIAKYYAPGMRDEAAAEASASKGKAAKSKKQPKTPKAQPKAAAEPRRKLTPEEQAERKKIGLILMCWGVILPVLIEEFILKPNVYPDWLAWDWLP